MKEKIWFVNRKLLQSDWYHFKSLEIEIEYVLPWILKLKSKENEITSWDKEKETKMRKLQKGGSSSGLLGWAARTNYILFERDTFRDGTGPEMVCVENKEKLPQKKAIKKTWRKILASPNLSQDNHNMGRCDHHIFRILPWHSFHNLLKNCFH